MQCKRRPQRHILPGPAVHHHQGRGPGNQPSRGGADSERNPVGPENRDQFRFRIDRHLRPHVWIDTAYLGHITRCAHRSDLNKTDLRVGADESGIYMFSGTVDDLRVRSNVYACSHCHNLPFVEENCSLFNRRSGYRVDCRTHDCDGVVLRLCRNLVGGIGSEHSNEEADRCPGNAGESRQSGRASPGGGSCACSLLSLPAV